MRTPFWIALVAMMISYPLANAQPAAEAPAAEEEGAEEKQPTEREQMLEIVKLYQTGEIDKAEAAFKQALEASPDSPVLANMHNLAYSALMRANRPAEALAHMEAATVHQMSEAARNGSAEMFSRLTGMLMAMSEQHLGAGEGAKVLDRLSAKADELPDASIAVKAAIDAQKASQMVAEGKTDEARALMVAHAEAAKKGAEENADDATAMRTYVSVMKDRISVEEKVEGGDADKLSEEMFSYLSEAAKSHPENAGMAYVMEVMTRAGTLARSEPEKAGELVKTARAYLEGDGAAIQLPPQFDRQIAQIESSIEQTIKMNALIGQEAAYPTDMQAWVNGEELTPESLKGKVVLLDFFAVWCGPCIATFPHLKEWHEEYSDQGFEIIGVTNYYEYGWDAEAKRPKREPGLEQKAEEEALGQFVAHYELRHPIAYGTDRSLSEHYMVSGIPHMVLIDRKGKVRMFRIGSGEANAHDIEEAIKECLAESADAPSS